MTTPFARTLNATDRAGIAARLRDYLSVDAAAPLLAAVDTRLVIVPAGAAERARNLASTLQRTGAVAAVAGDRVVVAATADQVRAARGLQPQFEPELEAIDTARRNAAEPPARLRMRDRVLDLSSEARVMGILNVTPDSFYERVGGVAEAVERAHAMADAGAALVDIGGQSYAHWNPRVAAEDERNRVVPAVEAIAGAGIDIALSIDTFKASVADAALAAGAHLINDCSGLSDPQLAETVARYDAALVIMHLKGELNVRAPGSYVYADAMAEIVEFLHARIERALHAGVAADAIAVDPGLEFGKEPATDLEILDRFGELTALGYPILFASSRKSFIGRIFNRPAKELLVPSLATAGLGITAGARMLRVHDVAETVQLARMYAAVQPRRRAALDVADRMPGTPPVGGNSKLPGGV